MLRVFPFLNGCHFYNTVFPYSCCIFFIMAFESSLSGWDTSIRSGSRRWSHASFHILSSFDLQSYGQWAWHRSSDLRLHRAPRSSLTEILGLSIDKVQLQTNNNFMTSIKKHLKQNLSECLLKTSSCSTKVKRRFNPKKTGSKNET